MLNTCRVIGPWSWPRSWTGTTSWAWPMPWARRQGEQGRLQGASRQQWSRW